MREGTCPKCGSTEIFTNQDRGLRSPRDRLTLGALSSVRVHAYICGACGHLEEFVDPAGLQKVRDKLDAR